jgi:hypothetical protein
MQVLADSYERVVSLSVPPDVLVICSLSRWALEGLERRHSAFRLEQRRRKSERHSNREVCAYAILYFVCATHGRSRSKSIIWVGAAVISTDSRAISANKHDGNNKVMELVVEAGKANHSAPSRPKMLLSEDSKRCCRFSAPISTLPGQTCYCHGSIIHSFSLVYGGYDGARTRDPCRYRSALGREEKKTAHEWQTSGSWRPCGGLIEPLKIP